MTTCWCGRRWCENLLAHRWCENLLAPRPAGLRSRGSGALALTLSLIALCGVAAAQPTTAPTPTPLLDQQEVFRAALAAVAPSLVRIDTIGGAQPVKRGDDEQQVVTGLRQADGPTTGVIWSPDGLILTSSFNFIRDPSIITVTLHDGRRLTARLVARDRHARLALLKVDAAGLPVARLIDTSALRPGQWALTAGFGLTGSTPAVSVGAVSALDRVSGMAVQTDAKVSPANYGGPLFDIVGRVMGILAPIAPGDDDEIAGLSWYDSGIGFAISVDHIARRLPRLREGRDLQRGLLGVNFVPGDPVVGAPPASQPTPSGLRVTGQPLGPAARAGIRTGDVVTHVAGEPTPRILEFRRILARYAAGDEVEVTWWHEGESRTAALRLATREEFRPPTASQPESQPAAAEP